MEPHTETDPLLVPIPPEYVGIGKGYAECSCRVSDGVVVVSKPDCRYHQSCDILVDIAAKSRAKTAWLRTLGYYVVAQKAFAIGDLEPVAQMLVSASEDRMKASALRVKSMRRLSDE